MPRSRAGWGFNVALGALLVASPLYLVSQNEALVARSGSPTVVDLVAGAVVVAAVLLLAWRATGWGLVAVASAALLYAIAGPWLPGVLAHRGYDPGRLIEQLFLSTEGIWGVPLGVSADFVYLFVLFGTFLDIAGGGALLIGLADRVAGRTRGGPAKTAAVASAFMGSLSGSAVANVVTTGTFTIPLMRRSGFRPFFAGRDRGRGQHGRPAHAAGHGGRRLHPGHLDQHPLRQSGAGGRDPRGALLRGPAVGHPLPCLEGGARGGGGRTFRGRSGGGFTSCSRWRSSCSCWRWGALPCGPHSGAWSRRCWPPWARPPSWRSGCRCWARILDGTAGAIVITTLTALIGVVALAGAVIGYVRGPIGLARRAVLLASAIALIGPGFLWDGIGLVLFLAAGLAGVRPGGGTPSTSSDPLSPPAANADVLTPDSVPLLASP